MRGIRSKAFSKSIKTTNILLLLLFFFSTCLYMNILSCTPLPFLKPHCVSSSCPSLVILNVFQKFFHISLTCYSQSVRQFLDNFYTPCCLLFYAQVFYYISALILSLLQTFAMIFVLQLILFFFTFILCSLYLPYVLLFLLLEYIFHVWFFNFYFSFYFTRSMNCAKYKINYKILLTIIGNIDAETIFKGERKKEENFYLRVHYGYYLLKTIEQRNNRAWLI